MGMKADDKNEITTLDAKDVFFNIMKYGGVTPEDLGDNRYGFSYKDEYFVAIVGECPASIRVVDYLWYNVSRWKAETVAELLQKINHVNSLGDAKVVYEYNEHDEMVLSTICLILLKEGIPGVENYFVSRLDRMLEVKDVIKGKATIEKEENTTTSSGESQEIGGEI